MPGLVYGLIAITGFALICTILYSTTLGLNAGRTFAPLVDATMEIKLNATTAHLWFEEIISGDPSIDIKEVWKLLDDTEWYANAMINGGQNSEGVYIPLKDPQLRREIQLVLVKLKQFRHISEVRLAQPDNSGIGSQIDQQFDTIFQDYITQTDKVESRLQEVINAELNKFRLIQGVLIVVAVMLSLLIAFIVRRFDNQRAQYTLTIEASNTQLSANNQQLMATEQQLRAANQQLLASDQQLRASNQQLSAGEEALKLSESRYRSLFENMSSGVAIYEAEDDGNNFIFKDFNITSEKIENTKRVDIIGKRVTDVFPGVRDMGLFQVLQNVWHTGKPEYFPISFYKDDKLEGWRENHVYKLPTGELVTIYDDVTEKKKAEFEIAKYRDHLEDLVNERTNQLQAVNKELEAFSYSVSHDLRTPLRSIDGFSKVLLEDNAAQLNEEGRDSLHRICRAAQKMGSLIDDMLLLSRLSRKKVEIKTLNLSPMAVTIINTLKEVAPERHVTVNIIPDITVEADESLMEAALTNLLGNAFKFTAKTKDALIEMGKELIENTEYIYIKDNGAGFDMTHAGKIFGAFQRLHHEEDFKGTGIGLATVQRIIHLHGGKIIAKGEVNKGAVFYFTI